MKTTTRPVVLKLHVRWWLAPIATCALFSAPAGADTVHRCEDSAGRITYSNETCPPGTRRSRAVDTSEPVVGTARAAAAAAGAAGAAAATTTKSAEKSEDKPADKGEAKGEAKVESKAEPAASEKSAATEKRARVAEGKVTTRTAQIDRSPTSPAAPVNVRKDTLCRDLATRVRFARQDLESASPSQRASSELALRRAQEDHDAECRTR